MLARWPRHLKVHDEMIERPGRLCAIIAASVLGTTRVIASVGINQKHAPGRSDPYLQEREQY